MARKWTVGIQIEQRTSVIRDVEDLIARELSSTTHYPRIAAYEGLDPSATSLVRSVRPLMNPAPVRDTVWREWGTCMLEKAADFGSPRS
jgi:hypothetical protein